MTPNIASLIEAIHAPTADVAALFAAHDSEILPLDSARSVHRYSGIVTRQADPLS